MAREPKWGIDPVIAETKDFEKWLREGEREHRIEVTAATAELHAIFTKQFRKMKVDCEGQIRRKKGEILQYKEREGGEVRHQKDITEAAKAKLKELQAELAVLTQGYTLSKRLMKTEFRKEIQAIEG
jgi:hypothetical protein